MKIQNGFTLLNKNEIASYLAKQKVTRKITRLQIHHDGGTWLKAKSGYYVNKKYMEFVRYA